MVDSCVKVKNFFVQFDEILAAFHINLQVHKIKAVTCCTTTAIKYAPEEQNEMQYTEISSNLRKKEFTYMYESTIKICLPKLSKWTIQDSIHRLIQTVHINQCIESQTRN